MVKRPVRFHSPLLEPGGLRRGISVVGRTLDTASSWPESCTAHLVRIGFGRNRIGIGSGWRHPAAEAGHTQVEASPEEVNGTGLADKLRPKFLEYRVTPRQHPPKSAHGVLI